MEILKLLQVLWRRKGTITASTLLFILVALFVSLIMPEQYTATTAVIIRTDDSATSLLSQVGLQEMAKTLGSGSDDVTNKIWIATSEPVITELIWKLQLRKGDGTLYDPEDVGDPGLLAPVFGTPGIVIEQEQGTDVLYVEATGDSPQTARLMADTLAEIYIRQQTDTSRAQFGDAKTFVTERIGVVTQELDDAYGEFAAVQQQTAVIDLDGEQKTAVSRLSELTLDREKTFGQIKETEARLRSEREYNALQSVDDVSQSALQNPIVSKLKQSLTELNTQRQAFLADHYTEKAPEVVAIDGKIAGVRAQLADELTHQQNLDPQVAELEADLAGLLARQESLTDAIDRMQNDATTWPELRRKFSQLQLQIEAAEGVYRELQDQSYQIGIAESMTVSDVRVAERAELPEDPSSPKLVLNLAAAILLGIMFGGASALAFEYLDDTIRNPEDTKDGWDLPVLGRIPKYRAGERPALANLPATDPLFEAHRAIRNAIDFAGVDKPVQLIGVTSSIPGEGKSTIAVNLAVAMAGEGRRVLLVDGDLRSPSQHKRFAGLQSAPGLVEVVSRTANPEDAVQRTPVANLDVLVAGDLPPNPAQLIESLRMRQALLELARGYEAVVIDMPPALAVNDPLVYSRIVDGTIVVVGAHEATRRMLSETAARFESARTKPIGFVLNKLRSGATPYARYAERYARMAASRQATARQATGNQAPPKASGGGVA